MDPDCPHRDKFHVFSEGRTIWDCMLNQEGGSDSVADPHNFDADPDPGCHFDVDPVRACHFDAVANPNPDPTFHFDADPDPSYQIKAQHLKKCLTRLIFNTFWLVICKLMRIRIELSLCCGSGSGFSLSL